MNRSESINELATALAKAQAEMKAAPKSRENPHFRSKYAPLNEVIDVAKVLAKYGLAFLQPARFTGEVVEVETVLMHSSGQWVSESLALKPQQNTPQGVGSAVTYGRRFGLSSLVGIAADEDDDGNEASGHKSNGKSHAAQAADESEHLFEGFKKRLVEAKDIPTIGKVAEDIKTAVDKSLITDGQKKLLLALYTERVKDIGGRAVA